MTLLALATWGAIGALVLGSVALFVWFLFDARGVLHGEGAGGAGGGEEELP